MKSLDYVKEHIDEFEGDKFLDSRFTKRFVSFLPSSEWEKFGYKYTGEKEFVPREWTEENILAQLKDDVEFGMEKASNHRGISASLMFEVVRGWCKVLENGMETIDYGYYGDKLFKAVNEEYNFGFDTQAIFDKNFYEEW